MGSLSRTRAAASLALLIATALLVAFVLAESVVRVAVPVRNVGPTFSEYDPVYGKRLKRSFACTRTTPEFTMRFSTNSLGFRGPEPGRFPERGVLFLGDSFTSGYGVDDGEEFPDLVRRGLEASGIDVPVVNAGSGNTGNGYWLHFLEREGTRFAPRLVVLGFCGNDFVDNVSDGLYEIGEDGVLASSVEPPRGEGTRRMQAMIDAVPGLASSHLVGLARQVFVETGQGPEGGGAGDDALTWAILDRVLAESDRRGMAVILLSIEVDGSRLARLSDLAAGHGIPLLTIPGRSERPDLYYRVDGHWNASGQAEVARQLLPLVRHSLDAGRAAASTSAEHPDQPGMGATRGSTSTPP